MSECLNEATCSPKPSQAFPAPLPSGIPADAITYAFDGDCPSVSGLDGCTPGTVSSVSQALDKLEDALCSLNPKGISKAPNCSPIVVKNGIATPVTALEALNCLPDGKPGDVPIFNGSDWVIGPILLEPSDCAYPCPPAADLILTSTGPNTAIWVSPEAAPPLVSDTTSVDLTVTGSTISGVVKVDPAQSILSVGPNGLTATIPAQTPVTVADTSSVDLTIAGQQITAAVKVDPIADNILVSGANGLYVPAAEPVGCADILPLLQQTSGCFPDRADSPTRVLSSGPSGIGYRNLPTLSDATTVSDSPSLDLTMTGNNVSGVVKVDPVANNRLTIGAAGLAVAPIGCSDLQPLLDRTTGCFPDRTDAPAKVLSSGPSGIGYRDLPTATAATPVTVVDTPSVDMTISGQAISGVVRLDPSVNNRITLTPNGLKVAPIDCLDIAGLLDPTDPATCYPQKTTTPALVLSTGSDGIGYRPIPTTAPAATTNVLSLGTPTATQQPITSTVNGITSTVNLPIASGGSTVVTATDSSSIDFTASGSNVTGVVIVDPAVGNKLSIGPSGLLVLPQTCTETLTSLKTTLTGGCLTTAAVCALPTALMGHQGGGNPQYYSGRQLYHAEAYPATNNAQQTLSNSGSTLNDITSLMSIVAGDENGLCPGEASFWDPALSRFTITRPGRYTVHWGLFMRLIWNNSGTTANASLYSGLRFIRPAGTVNGRSVSAQANTLRGGQYSPFVGAPAATQDWHSTGSHTFIATAGTQLSLRAVAILGTGVTITSFIVRGDSGHFSLSQLADREF